RKYWRIAELPSFRPWNWIELRAHHKSSLLVVSPPAGKARQVELMGVTLMHEASGQRARAGVQILVAAPDCEVDIAVVQIQLQVAGSVRQVEAYQTSFCMRGCSNCSDVECLSGEIVDIAQHDKRDRLSLTLDQIDDVFGAQSHLRGSRLK